MDAVLEIAAKVLVTAGALGSLVLIPLGLPGNFVLAVLGLAGVALGLGWTLFWILLAAALVGEGVEFFASMGLARRTGAGRSGMWGAFLGGLVGGILFTPLLPIPLVGTLIGAALGAFAGAVLFEFLLSSRSAWESLRAGKGAFLGVLLGRLLKLWLGFGQAGYLVLSLWGLMPGGNPAD